MSNVFANIRSQSGFTLLEIMIAVLVLAVGAIGMAGLQFASLRNNQQSYQRGQVAALANEAADMMRANRVVAGTGTYLLALTTTVTNSKDCSASVDCSAAEMANYDLYIWKTHVTSTLPGAKTRITCSVSPCKRGDMQTVTIMWDEGRTGATGTACGVNDLSCYSLSLTP